MIPATSVIVDGSVFATVGTTRFDDLVQSLVQDNFLQVLHERGYRHLLIQIGRGRVEPVTATRCGIDISWYRFKPSIREDILAADLVISHAGAGSILEAVSLKKRLLVVVNDTLMDNHQAELAENFGNQGFLFWTSVDRLYIDFYAFDLNWHTLKPYQPGRPELFAQYMDKFFGE